MAPAKKAKKAVAKKAATSTPRSLFKAAYLGRSIKASTIYQLWVDVLGRSIKDLDDGCDVYGITNVIAYVDFLNHTSQFSPYHLDLQTADVVNVQNMGDLGAAIVKNFQDNGYTVTAN